MKVVKFMTPLLAFSAIIACAPISKDQCRVGNWRELGLRDGANGRLTSHVERYAKECGEIGVVPDRQAWLAGRKEGLHLYCNAQRAEQLGRRGIELRPVCNNQAELEPYNARGQLYYVLHEELDDLKDQRREIRSILSSQFNGELTNDERALRRRYVRLLRKVESRIDEIEWRLRRLGW